LGFGATRGLDSHVSYRYIGKDLGGGGDRLWQGGEAAGAPGREWWRTLVGQWRWWVVEANPVVGAARNGAGGR